MEGVINASERIRQENRTRERLLGTSYLGQNTAKAFEWKLNLNEALNCS